MQRENEIPKSSLTSAVTTDMANDDGAAAAEAQAMEDHYEADPLVACGLGLIKVDGVDKRYIGLPPALDESAELPSGLKITPDNSTFIPLWQVPFSNSIEIKDPATGTFYYPKDGVTSWMGCELDGNVLVPPVEPPPDPGEGGEGGNGEHVASQRSFAGSGTSSQLVDPMPDAASVASVEIEGGVYPVPPYTVGASNDELTTTDSSVWQAGVNVLVNAKWTDEAPVADASSKKKGAAKKEPIEFEEEEVEVGGSKKKKR